MINYYLGLSQGILIVGIALLFSYIIVRLSGMKINWEVVPIGD